MKTKVIKLLILAILVLTVFQLQFFACTKYGTSPDRTVFQEAEVVFTGKITKIRKLKNIDVIPDNWKELTFKITNNYKGVKDRTIKILTADYGTCKGIKVKKGESWLIFADFNNTVETTEISKGYEQFRGYKVEEKNNYVIETIEKAAKNQLPTEISVEIANVFNPFMPYSGEVDISLIGKETNETFKIKDGFFNLKNISGGKYKVKFNFKNKVVLNYALNDFTIVSKKPDIIEIEVTVKNNELKYIFFEASEDTKSDS